MDESLNGIKGDNAPKAVVNSLEKVVPVSLPTKGGEPANSAKTITERPKDADLKPEVLKCDWERFINRFSPDEPLYMIEALTASDRLTQDILKEAAKRRASGQLKEYTSNEQSRVRRVQDNKTWIQRIRIQSTALLDVFTRVTGHAWGPLSYTFMRPFQYLIHSHDMIKGELERLEAAAAAAAEADKDQENGTSVGKEKDKEFYELLHLRAYVEFAERDILPEFQSRRSQSSPGHGGSNSSPKILFSDLWYLFRQGDLIFMPRETLRRNNRDLRYVATMPNHESSMSQEIWRLYHVILPSSMPLSSFCLEDSRDPFIGHMYSLDYDGRRYSPILRSFAIDYFEGLKSIRDLDFYPLRFASDADTLLAEGRATGARFLDCMERWHMTYNHWSLTTDPVGEPIIDYESPNLHQVAPVFIDGEVVVDFNESFYENTQYFNNFKNPERECSLLDAEEMGNPVVGEDPLLIWDSTDRKKLLAIHNEVIVPSDDVEKADTKSVLRWGGGEEAGGRYKDNNNYKIGSAPNIIPEGDDLALLPRRVFIFSLKHSIFAPVDVNYMQEIDYRTDGFSRLQLPEGHKRMLDSAVRSHLRRKRIEKAILSGADGSGASRGRTDAAHLATQDFIRDKGRGLIIMLHGEPGVGKTASAEAVAQTYRRPLFTISCGHLVGSYKLERVLGKVFRWANLWDCILLLDEADVLLSARTASDDMERNSMVSTFLRMLEYYNGILFLTTNRIGKIDSAIASRIHMMLHYRRLGKPEIENVFRINADRLREAEQQQAEASGEQPLVVVWSDIQQFIEDHWKAHPKGKGAWNGRQVRNAFIVATALARAEAEKQPEGVQPQVRYTHFKQVENLSGDYANFMQHVLGHDDAEIARLNEERDDDYEGLQAGHETKEDEKLRQQQQGHGQMGGFQGQMAHSPAHWSRIGFMPGQPQQHQQFGSPMANQQVGVGMSASGSMGASGMGGSSHSHSSPYSHQGLPQDPMEAQQGHPWANYTQNPGHR